MKHLFGKHILIFFVLLLPAVTFAQNGGFAGAFTRIGFGPRGLAMGNTLSSVTSEGVYAYYNPALAGSAREGSQVDLSVAALEFDRSLQHFSASFKLPPNAGINLYLTHAGVKDIDGRTQSGFHTGFFSTNEYQVAGAFGVQLGKRTYGGIGVKINASDFNEDLSIATNFGLDAGIIAGITSKINLAVAIQDLFSEYNFNSEDLFGTTGAPNVTNSFPTRFKFAVSYNEEKWLLSSEFEVRVQESEIIEKETIVLQGRPEVTENKSTIHTSSGIFRIGGLYHIHERITLRGGFRIMDTADSGSDSYSTGFSLHLPFDKFAPSVDYAFVIEPYQVSNMHVFSLRLHL